MTQGKTAAIEAVIYIFFILVSLVLRKYRVPSRHIVNGSFYLSVPIVFIGLFIVSLFVNDGVFTFSGRTSSWGFFIKDLGNWIVFGKGGVSVLSDPDLIKRAMDEGIRNGAIDSTPILILYTYGVMGVLLWVMFVGKCMKRVRELAKIDLSIFVFISIILFFIHAFLESSCQLGLTMPTFSILILILMLEKQSFSAIQASQIMSKSAASGASGVSGGFQERGSL